MAEVGALKNLSAWPPSLHLHLHRNPSPKPFNFKPSPHLRNPFRICHCSLVNEQQRETASFTEEEKQLIDALIGIQGRGRSASPHQLNVQSPISIQFLCHFSFYFF